ncbi:MAG: repeat-containing protein, partial [Caulobacteraceae bacterium]|nr:repeat-containing protein [Caulobacteraceae bacterium]
MKLRLALCASLFAGSLLAGGYGSAALGADTLTNATLKEQVPVFELDKTWPQLPNNWVLGVTSKVAIDSHGNAWILHRPHTATTGTPAPPVVVLDKNGKFVRAWGGPAAGYDWPDSEHNIIIDAKDNVTISGSS